MKTNSIMAALAISVLTLFCSSCGPLIFQATFNSDTVNSPPNLRPPGNPSGDQIKGSCGITVINSSVLNSKAMRFYNDTECLPALVWFEAEPVDASNKFLNYSFTGYPESTTHKDFYISFSGGHFKAAFKILYDDGTMYLTDGGYNKHNIGTYTANQKQTFLAGINRTTNQYNLSIIRPGATNIVLSNRPVLESDFWGVSAYLLYLFYDIADNSNSPNGYVIDEVRINKEKN